MLQLFNAAHGCLVEIELVQLQALVDGARQWLWIEGNMVTVLQLLDGKLSEKRVFDRAVLTFDGVQGQLCWPGGPPDVLSIDASGTLRPEFQRLLHQHLN
ncbi:hypothetical protein [Roseateles flavus]|uniref:DUF2442 domain-containing protein n=1 Tax=Roseateles flavus TaxID=3149041 RepID=A0ABV0GGB7_9BURK